MRLRLCALFLLFLVVSSSASSLDNIPPLMRENTERILETLMKSQTQLEILSIELNQLRENWKRSNESLMTLKSSYEEVLLINEELTLENEKMKSKIWKYRTITFVSIAVTCGMIILMYSSR